LRERRRWSSSLSPRHQALVVQAVGVTDQSGSSPTARCRGWELLIQHLEHDVTPHGVGDDADASHFLEPLAGTSWVNWKLNSDVTGSDSR
jgi:hypothetical protein